MSPPSSEPSPPWLVRNPLFPSTLWLQEIPLSSQTHRTHSASVFAGCVSHRLKWSPKISKRSFSALLPSLFLWHTHSGHLLSSPVSGIHFPVPQFGKFSNADSWSKCSVPLMFFLLLRIRTLQCLLLNA